MTILFEFSRPAVEWPLVWEPMVLSPMHRCGPREDVEVPFRRCPHGGYFFDETCAPPRLLNAWGFFDSPRCDSALCRAAVRAHHGGGGGGQGWGRFPPVTEEPR